MRPTWTKIGKKFEDFEWDHPRPILVKMLNEFTVGDEGNSSRESDQPLVGVLNVEQAAARLEIIYNFFKFSIFVF